MSSVNIHPRVCRRHPELTEDDVLTAWDCAVALVRRETLEKDIFVAVGPDANGRLLEVVAVQDDKGDWLVFHAMTPPTKKTLKELGLIRSR